MRLPAAVKPGTRVDCNVRGRKFSATVLERTADGLAIDPPKGNTYFHVTAQQVTKLHRWDPKQTQICHARP